MKVWPDCVLCYVEAAMSLLLKASIWMIWKTSMWREVSMWSQEQIVVSIITVERKGASAHDFSIVQTTYPFLQIIYFASAP